MFRWIHHARQRPRLLISALIGAASFFCLLQWQQIDTIRAMLLGFNVGASFYLALVIHVMSQATTDSMRQRARLQVEGKWMVLSFGLIVSVMTIVALYWELHASKNSAWDVALATVTIFLSWIFLATLFSQEYAHGFYTAHAADGGLIFPGTHKPDYWDFMYFSVVISMTFQVSDVQITSRSLRHLVLLHSVAAFFFNVIIIAITVNVVAGSL